MLLFCAFCLQVSEQQLNEAIAQAVENSKLKKDKSQWSMEGNVMITQEGVQVESETVGGRKRGRERARLREGEREIETEREKEKLPLITYLFNPYSHCSVSFDLPRLEVFQHKNTF